MAEASTELSPTMSTEEFLGVLHQLPDTVAAMGQFGVRAVLRFSVPEDLRLTVIPSSPITGEEHQVGKVSGLMEREFSGSKPRRSSSAFRVISFVVANPGDLPGEGNNMLAYGVKRSHYSITRQKVSYFNLFDHSFEVGGTTTAIDPEVAGVREHGFSWVTNYPDSKYPDNFISRGLDLS